MELPVAGMMAGYASSAPWPGNPRKATWATFESVGLPSSPFLLHAALPELSSPQFQSRSKERKRLTFESGKKKNRINPLHPRPPPHPPHPPLWHDAHAPPLDDPPCLAAVPARAVENSRTRAGAAVQQDPRRVRGAEEDESGVVSPCDGKVDV